MSRTIPRKDVEFDESQRVITGITEQNLIEWRIDVDWYKAAISIVKKNWMDTWESWLNPNTRTKVITFNKNQARTQYESALRNLINMMKTNPFIPVSELTAMGINTNRGSGGKRNPVPVTYPNCDIDSSTIRRLTIKFYDQSTHSSAKPHGVHGAEIRWGILTAAPVDVKELVNTAFDTRSPLTLEFEGHERGATVWFCLRWENTTGEKGPWGEIVSAIVP